MSADQTLEGESGTTYLVNFGSNAQCRVEEATGMTYPDVLAALKTSRPSVKVIRGLIKGLLVNQPVTDEQAGMILDDLGGWRLIQAALEMVPVIPDAATALEPAHA